VGHATKGWYCCGRYQTLLFVVAVPNLSDIELVRQSRGARVSTKQSNFFFGSDRNKPKLNLFWLFFGLFRKTKKHFFQFVSVFRTDIKTTETNRILSKQTEKISKKCSQMFFELLFRETPQKNFSQFVSMFRTNIEKNRTYGLGN
jgi:hypothetical protein